MQAATQPSLGPVSLGSPNTHLTPMMSSPPLGQSPPSPQQYAHHSPSQQNSSSTSRQTVRHGGSSDPASSPYQASQPSQYYSPARTNASSGASTPADQSRVTSGASHPPTSAGRAYATSHMSSVSGPVAPPRTSSQKGQGVSVASSDADVSLPAQSRFESSSRERVPTTTSLPDRTARGHRDASDGPADVDRPSPGNENAATSASRRRRRDEQIAMEDTPRTPTAGDSQARSSPATQHSHHRGGADATDTLATDPTVTREGSTVINRVVVTDPEVDRVRQMERDAETTPRTANGARPNQVNGLAVVNGEGVEDGPRSGGRSRQEHSNGSSRRKEIRFGDYVLGQTLGEGEFGKVKMGWKKTGGVQVAIKLIRRESVASNPTRLPKIYREIAILRELDHPNIVRLHEMVETERHIGIILEYASGGELFDYILNHRYLKDVHARRLFAQLISGVGYLHKKGIVHRDLKLENLLLDRHKNIIITDFGFANTFNADDELGEDIEMQLEKKDTIKRLGLDRVRANGFRRGDLMQTSCGSPCYAAPELVVSDSLYTGRKVDVWSCGVILYAMLAGYLPFDDDPDNPEGDNINLLYKYIVTTPLTFPEYVTPHARDLLKRILVPNPRHRADLFEVARHSWLSEYSSITSLITSSTTTTGDIRSTTVADGDDDIPHLARSASVREPTSRSHQPPTPVGGLTQKHGTIEQGSASTQPKTQRDNKRRTLQVEYVAPSSQTVRGESDVAGSPQTAQRTAESSARTPTRPKDQSGQLVTADGQIDTAQSATRPDTDYDQRTPKLTMQDQRQPNGPREETPRAGTAAARPSSSRQTATRPARDPIRAISDTTGPYNGDGSTAMPTATRPVTSGSTFSDSSKLPSRGSYSRPVQPLAPSATSANAQGRLSQPRPQKPYVISNPIPLPDNAARISTPPDRPAGSTSGTTGPKNHKRSNTISGLGEKIGTLFGRGPAAYDMNTGQSTPPRNQARPPTSFNEPQGPRQGRTSTESRRSSSFGFSRRGSTAGEKSRRFSLIPASFSFRNFSSGESKHKDYAPPSTAQSQSDHVLPTAPGSRGGFAVTAPTQDRTVSRGRTGNTSVPSNREEDDMRTYQEQPDVQQGSYNPTYSNRSQHQQRTPQQASSYSNPRGYTPQQAPYASSFSPGPNESALTTESESSLKPHPNSRAPYPQGLDSHENDGRVRMQQNGRAVLHRNNNRKFVDGYEREGDNAYGQAGHHGGSSAAARRVMNFFGIRRKARADYG